jgi:signal transduction histidine kinase
VQQIRSNKEKAMNQRYSKAIEHNEEKMKKFISMGENSSILLLSLIEDILDLSKMEAGTFKINMISFNVEKMVNEVYDIFYFQCMLKKMQLNLEIDSEIKGIIAFSD